MAAAGGYSTTAGLPITGHLGDSGPASRQSRLLLEPRHLQLLGVLGTAGFFEGYDLNVVIVALLDAAQGPFLLAAAKHQQVDVAFRASSSFVLARASLPARHWLRARMRMSDELLIPRGWMPAPVPLRPPLAHNMAVVQVASAGSWG